MKEKQTSPVVRGGEYTFRVTLEQTDALGLIHNSVVFRLFEVAELEWFRELNIHWLEFDDVCFPRIKVNAEFLRPVRFDDHCVITTKVVSLKAARVLLSHEIRNSEHGNVMIRGTVEFACVSKDTFRPQVLPEKMRTILNSNI